MLGYAELLLGVVWCEWVDFFFSFSYLLVVLPCSTRGGLEYSGAMDY